MLSIHFFTELELIMNQAHMRTACGRVHTHKHMHNEVNRALISMGSNIVNKQVN